MTKLLKELLALSEERDPALQYTEKLVKNKIDRVIVSLTGNQSGRFTKLVKQYKDVKEEMEALETVRGALNETIKEELVPLFNATDEVYTRVVETVGASLVLSKRVAESTKTTTDYEKIYAAMVELVGEDLKTKLEELKKAFTETSKVAEKSPGLRVDIKEGVIKSIVSLIKGIISKFTTGLNGWLGTYDRKLDKLRVQIEDLNLAEVVKEENESGSPAFKVDTLEFYFDVDGDETSAYIYYIGAKTKEEAEDILLDHVKELDAFLEKQGKSIADANLISSKFDKVELVWVDRLKF